MSWLRRLLKLNIKLLTLLIISFLFVPCINAKEIIIISNRELQEFNRIQPKPLSLSEIKRIYTRVKLFALEAVEKNLVEKPPVSVKEEAKYALIYGEYVCHSWQPSEEAILSFYLSHKDRFKDCSKVLSLDEAKPEIIKILRNAACKKLLYQEEEKLKQKFVIKFEKMS